MRVDLYNFVLSSTPFVLILIWWLYQQGGVEFSGVEIISHDSHKCFIGFFELLSKPNIDNSFVIHSTSSQNTNASTKPQRREKEASK